MTVIVDATVWSLAFRRRRAVAPEAEVLSRLLRNDAVVLLGAVRQETLSGIRDAAAFRRLRDLLRKTPDYPLRTDHYEAAAEAYNTCRRHGIPGAHTDFLICAVALIGRLPIFTADNDFQRYARYLPIKLYAR